MHHSWPVVEREVAYETGWYDAGYDLVEQPDGSTKRYYWVELPPAVVVVAVTDEDVVFVRQYRPTIEEIHLELPAGIVEPDESFVEAGRRELEEETGYRAQDCTLLQTYAVATGVLRHSRGVVVATNLREGERSLDTNEFLEIERIPRSNAIARARQSPANDSTLSGLYLAADDGYL